MRSILDPGFRYTPSVATDIRKTFERVSRELGACKYQQRELPARGSDAREPLPLAAANDGEGVLLECDGDLVDVSAIKYLGLRRAAGRFEMLVFVCPRCNAQHESLRFR
jgi:hypothetical protein